MPELPEVETVRRMLDAHVLGAVVRDVRLSGKRMRTPFSRATARRLIGRRFTSTGRHGKYLFLHFDFGLTLLSHLGMSGRWLFDRDAEDDALPHVHATFSLAGGGRLRFQDPRRFGLLRLVATSKLAREPEIAQLGPDPIATPADPLDLARRARGRSAAVKVFLLDQAQIAGIGNIYASEILYRVGIHPSRRAGRISPDEWGAIATATGQVLGEAISRMGTTFSAYRTLWNEPGSYGEQLRVYDRANQPCRTCGTPIRRRVLGQRATYFCPICQPAKPLPRQNANPKKVR
jgi:formamidopyrimidine-DNA glycosylase